VGPILGGLIFDALGSYTRVWQLNMVLLAVAALVILTLEKHRPDS
jgi:cyanate permease